MRAFCLILAVLPLPALACPLGTVLLSCPIGKNQLQVCLTPQAVTYSFGPAGAPDLSLTSPIRDAAYTPWPGIGSAIWDSLSFTNAGTTYEVWTSVERSPESTKGYQGGVNVLKGDTLLAQLLCKDGTVQTDLSPVFDAKESAGQCWNFGTLAWQTAPCP